MAALLGTERLCAMFVLSWVPYPNQWRSSTEGYRRLGHFHNSWWMPPHLGYILGYAVHVCTSPLEDGKKHSQRVCKAPVNVAVLGPSSQQSPVLSLL